MPLIPANRAGHPFIHGVSDSANSHYRKIPGQLRDSLGDSDRPNMSVCEQTVLNLWQERNPGRTPDTRVCAFTLTRFDPYWERAIQDELAILVTQLTLSPRGIIRPLHQLILGPVWLHELLTGTWTRTGGSWYAFATDVPDGEPVLGLGARKLCEEASVYEMLAALWNADPLTEYFDPANVLEAAYLL